MIKFLSLYSRIEEMGAYKESLIAFQSFPYEWKTVDRGNGLAESVVTKYEYRLRINLWLIILDFKWESSN